MLSQYVKTWFSNMNNPIQDEEAAFIKQEGDLIAVVARDKTPLRRFMEKIGAVCCFRVSKVSFAYRSARLLHLLTALLSSSTPPNVKAAPQSTPESH